MKVIHLTYGFGLGGIETMLTNIANEQAVFGYEVHIVVINDIVDNGLKMTLDKRVYFHCLMRKLGSKSPLPYLQLNWLLKKLDGDVIHLHYSSIARYIQLPDLKKKLCVTQHDVCNLGNSKYLYKSKRIYAISNIVKEDIWQKAYLKSEVVMNGIRPELIDNTPHIIGETYRIVQVSRLMHEKKGQHVLIKAVAKLVEKGYRNISLDLIGNGESLKYLKNLVENLGINSYVNFLGKREQSYIFAHLHDYDLFVQPSIYEGFGLTVTEAMAAKVPVLVSENQGPLEIIDNGRFGYSFKNKDADDCAAKIEQFLKGENDMTMVEKAYVRVQALYNVKVTAATYLQKYKEFINSNYAQIH